MATQATETQNSQLQNETTTLSNKYDSLEGTGPEPYGAIQALKDKIKLHYDVASDYYLSLWGEHIHHGYFLNPTESKETAQENLIKLLLDISSITTTTSTTTADAASTNTPLRALDVGCGVGGTTRYLARTLGAEVTGLTISGKQVEIATRLSLKESSSSTSTIPTNTTTTTTPSTNGHGSDISTTAASKSFIPLGEKGGQVKFIELDAEKMGDYFSNTTDKPITNSSDRNGDEQEKGKFDIVWISEALSHFPNKELFFRNAFAVLKKGGKLVVADWFKAGGLGEKEFMGDIKPIEDGMLLPPLCVQDDYVRMATNAGLKVLGGPKDISKGVAKTWDITWSLIQNPSLWAFAFSQGRDGVAFLQAFRAMRRGYANGTFRYSVMAFEKQ